MSYQAEERYWTDYLRIALPIAGLLLLLGVFWYWASSFIGDDNENPQTTPEVAVVTTPVTANTPTPTITSAVTIAVQTTEPAQQTQPATLPTNQPEAQTTATTESGEPGDTGSDSFAEGDFVIVNDNDVNMRTDSTTDAEVVATLSDGDELTILSGEPVDDGTYVWWNVENIDALSGWVAGDFLEPSP